MEMKVEMIGEFAKGVLSTGIGPLRLHRRRLVINLFMPERGSFFEVGDHVAGRGDDEFRRRYR